MKIDYLNYKNKDGQTAVFGINVARADTHVSKPYVHLFDLQKSREQVELQENIWGVTQHVLATKFDNRFARHDVIWTYTTGKQSTLINFSALNGVPYALSLTNELAYLYEGKYSDNNDLSRYEREYDLKDGMLSPVSNLHKKPYTVSVVPCEQAVDGIFYCHSSCEETFGKNASDLFLADTDKLLKNIQDHFPWSITQAKRKHQQNALTKNYNATPETCLHRNSYANSYYTGQFIVCDSDTKPGEKGVLMRGGDIAMLVLAKELTLPYLPIAIDADGDIAACNAIKRTIAYQP